MGLNIWYTFLLLIPNFSSSEIFHEYLRFFRSADPQVVNTYYFFISRSNYSIHSAATFKMYKVCSRAFKSPPTQNALGSFPCVQVSLVLT